MEYHLEKVHQASLDILKEIDRICRKYKIKYLLDSGTLIGAVRHQGFIPWDDDADVAFTRNHYDAFLKVAKRELPSNMELLLPAKLQNGKVFFDFTARIIYKNSKVHEDNEEMAYYGGKLNHIWVDLFTIDAFPQTKSNANLTGFLQKAVYGMAMGHRYHLDYEKYSKFHKIAVGGLATIGRIIPMKILYHWQDMISKKDKKTVTNLRYYSNYQPDYLYVVLEKEWCEETVDLDFCGMKLMAPKGWHQVLTVVYGDYMQLPPKEQRVPSHSSMEIQVYEEEIL